MVSRSAAASVRPLPGCKTFNDTYSDLNIVLYFAKEKKGGLLSYLHTYIHKYPNNLLEDEIQCIVGVTCMGSVATSFYSVQPLYNGGKCDQAADPAPRSGTYR